jgi:hypothetical protein
VSKEGVLILAIAPMSALAGEGRRDMLLHPLAKGREFRHRRRITEEEIASFAERVEQGQGRAAHGDIVLVHVPIKERLEQERPDVAAGDFGIVDLDC